MISSMIRMAALVVVTAILLLTGPAPSEAQIYRWVDERGVPHFSEGIDSIPEQYRQSAVPLGLRNTPTAPSAPAAGDAAGAPGGRGGTQIKFTPGRAIVVEALLNGGTPTRLLLDTGAEKTLINPRVLAAAGASLTAGPAAQIRGATGTAAVRRVPLDSLSVGGAKVSNLLVISHDIEQEGVDGLLGRDFLDQFKVSIDSREGVVTLGPK
jgi:predicted aspartyl protease